MEFQSQKDRPTAQIIGINMIARKRRVAGAVKIKIAVCFLIPYPCFLSFLPAIILLWLLPGLQFSVLLQKLLLVFPVSGQWSELHC